MAERSGMRSRVRETGTIIVVNIDLARLYQRKYHDIDTDTYSSSALISERILVLANALVRSNILTQSSSRSQVMKSHLIIGCRAVCKPFAKIQLKGSNVAVSPSREVSSTGVYLYTI